jgi:hypothetical protein
LYGTGDCMLICAEAYEVSAAMVAMVVKVCMMKVVLVFTVVEGVSVALLLE